VDDQPQQDKVNSRRHGWAEEKARSAVDIQRAQHFNPRHVCDEQSQNAALLSVWLPSKQHN